MQTLELKVIKMGKRTETVIRTLGKSRMINLNRRGFNEGNIVHVHILEEIDSEDVASDEIIKFLLEREDFEIFEIEGNLRLVWKQKIGRRLDRDEELVQAIPLGKDFVELNDDAKRLAAIDIREEEQ